MESLKQDERLDSFCPQHEFFWRSRSLCRMLTTRVLKPSLWRPCTTCTWLARLPKWQKLLDQAEFVKRLSPSLCLSLVSECFSWFEILPGKGVHSAAKQTKSTSTCSTARSEDLKSWDVLIILEFWPLAHLSSNTWRLAGGPTLPSWTNTRQEFWAAWSSTQSQTSQPKTNAGGTAALCHSTPEAESRWKKQHAQTYCQLKKKATWNL